MNNPTSISGRLIVHDRETHLEPDTDTVTVGDTFEVIRGNGAREGGHLGFATVTGIEDDGPVLDIRFG